MTEKEAARQFVEEVYIRSFWPGSELAKERAVLRHRYQRDLRLLKAKHQKKGNKKPCH